MHVGFVGLGLLGLPMAMAIASRGHTIYGYDVNPDRLDSSWYTGLETWPDGQPLEEVIDKIPFNSSWQFKLQAKTVMTVQANIHREEWIMI